MRKINILLLDTKDSDRCPGKNRDLWPYTTEYLEMYGDSFQPTDKVTIYIMYTEKTESNSPLWPRKSELKENVTVTPVQVPHGKFNTTKECLDYLAAKFKFAATDFNILLQLTQPVRRPYLMRNAIDELERTDCRLVRTYVDWSYDLWRVLEDSGLLEEKYTQGKASRRSDGRLYDGALYAWTGSHAWLGKPNPGYGNWIRNYVGPVVDIDYKEELNKDYIAGVRALAKNNVGWWI